MYFKTNYVFFLLSHSDTPEFLIFLFSKPWVLKLVLALQYKEDMYEDGMVIKTVMKSGFSTAKPDGLARVFFDYQITHQDMIILSSIPSNQNAKNETHKTQIKMLKKKTEEHKQEEIKETKETKEIPEKTLVTPVKTQNQLNKSEPKAPNKEDLKLKFKSAKALFDPTRNAINSHPKLGLQFYKDRKTHFMYLKEFRFSSVFENLITSMKKFEVAHVQAFAGPKFNNFGLEPKSKKKNEGGEGTENDEKPERENGLETVFEIGKDYEAVKTALEKKYAKTFPEILEDRKTFIINI